MQSARMAQEIEIKLEVPPAALERLEASRWFARRAGMVRREQQRSVYFDTPELELRDEGVALRVRQIGQRRLQTVKAARPEQALARQEFERELEGDAPDLKRARGAERRVTKKLKRKLSPVFETHVERTIVPLRRQGAELEIAIDRGEIRAGKRVEPISEIEVELKGGELGGLVQMARILGERFEVRYGVRSKAERGYALLEKANVKAARAEDLELAKSIDVAGGFQLIGLACLRHFALNEPALQRGDVEGVHQMRVGLRRLRAAISLFKELTLDDETAELKLELARSAVASDRCRLIVLRVALWLLGGDWTRESSKRLRRLRQGRLRSLARRALASRTSKVGKRLQKLEQLDEAQRHKLRIGVKKLHYAAEFFATLFPQGARRRKRYLDLLKELQDGLGRLNDIQIHAKLARDIVHPPPDTPAPLPGREEAFGMGLVAGTEEAETRALLRTTVRAGARLTRLPTFWR